MTFKKTATSIPALGPRARRACELAVVAAIGLAAASGAHAQTRELGSSGELLDGIAAVVNSGVVLKSELARRLQLEVQEDLQQQMQLPPEQRPPLPPIEAYEQAVLERLIIEEILVQRAARAGIIIGDDLVNEVVAESAARNGVPLEQMPTVLAQQGLDYASFREDQRRALTIETLVRNDILQDVAAKITEREIEQCINRKQASETEQVDYNTSHILISFPDGADPDVVAEAQERARDVVRQLDEGADFAQLALAYSDASTALDGGALGWRKGAALPSMFADEVPSMEAGEHSTPIRGRGGFQIVRLNDKRGIEPELVDQVRARHVLLTTNEVLDDDATMQKLEGIRDLIVGGEDFATVAQVQSEDTASAIDGGDLGWAEPGAYDPAVAAQLEALEIGKLSEPFKSEFGWHIVEVTGRRSHDITNERTEQSCRNEIGGAKLTEERDLWEQRLRDEAFVVKRL